MKETILERISKNRLILDGGMGSLLQSRGLKAGEPSEAWSLTHPDALYEIHREYFNAGCDVASANTFGVNSLKYDDKTIEKMVHSAVDAARRAADEFRGKYVALDIGPLGRLLSPYGDLSFEDAVNAFKKTITTGADAGADFILIETMNDSYETKAAVIAAKESCDLPIFVTNVYDESAKLMTGADIPAMCALLEGLGVSAYGMNCSLGPEQMLKLVPKFLECSSLPIIVTPNAGLPKSVNGAPVYDVDASSFCDYMVKIAELGVQILGGCCGTNPEYMRLTCEKTANIAYRAPQKKDRCVVSSYTHAQVIGQKPVLIGERINPTGKPKLKEALRSGEMSFILKEALTQEERGAHILDVNTGLPDIDEAAKLKQIVKEIQSVCALPLQIDTASPAAMEGAIRIYNGKPLINSVNGKKESMDAIFPLVKKYGGAVIALTLDENGIPDTAQGRRDIAERIMREAEKYGIDKRDIIVDPLAMAVSSQPDSAQVTLDALSLIRDELGLYTSLGVSNISFGLPERDYLTSAFFTCAMEHGLSLAIMNPCSDEMMKAYLSYLALKGYDDRFEKYIDFASKSAANTPKTTEDASVSLKSAILKGLSEQAVNCVRNELKNSTPMDVINGHIIPALNEVGTGFENKTVYLPQLLMSAEAAGAAFEEVKASLPPKSEKGDLIIIATVKGDIHDIGKNIVRTLLENFGFDVIDLGKDVDAEIIVREAERTGCRLVGLSALMTTTVPAMQRTIELLKERCPDTLTMVGGAVLTQDYADMIGASHYAPDAMEAVRYAQEVFKK